MRRAHVIVALLAFVVLAGCGSASPASLASSSPPAGDLPPVWVQSEALWQSLPPANLIPDRVSGSRPALPVPPAWREVRRAIFASSARQARSTWWSCRATSHRRQGRVRRP